VEAVSEMIVDNLEIVQRTFRLKNTDHPEEPERDVYQFQYGGWPDNGAPKDSVAIRYLVRKVRSLQEKIVGSLQGDTEPPIIVHCSAGIGRTGAFCTIYTNMQIMDAYIKKHTEDGTLEDIIKAASEKKQHKVDNDNLRMSSVLLKSRLSCTSYDENANCATADRKSLSTEPLSFNIYQTVLSLRRCRAGMVQSPDQYIFCYKAIIDEARAQNLLPPEESSSPEEYPPKSLSSIESSQSPHFKVDFNSSIDFSSVSSSNHWDPVLSDPEFSLTRSPSRRMLLSENDDSSSSSGIHLQDNPIGCQNFSTLLSQASLFNAPPSSSSPKSEADHQDLHPSGGWSNCQSEINPKLSHSLLPLKACDDTLRGSGKSLLMYPAQSNNDVDSAELQCPPLSLSRSSIAFMTDHSP